MEDLKFSALDTRKSEDKDYDNWKLKIIKIYLKTYTSRYVALKGYDKINVKIV